MINGNLKEATQGFAVLEDVDGGTFLRFIRWTYSADYPAREHSLVIPEPGPVEDTSKDTTADADDWGTWGFAKKDKKKKKKDKTTEPAVKGYLREDFISSDEGGGFSFGNYIPSARANKGPDEEYTEVFLGHARMYVFADKYDIQKLKTLALQKLQHQLAIHTLYLERVCEISTLLSYVYANTTDKAEDIRSMLAHYVGVEMANLVKDGEIKDLMLEEPDMLHDFLKMFALKVN